jgi:hypothetical protein
MLSKNNKKKVHLALALTVISLGVVSLIVTTTAPDYASAQVNSSQNATTTGSIPSATTGMNATNTTTTSAGGNQSTTEVRSLIEQARATLQNNDIQGALMNLNLALDALEPAGDGEQSNMTATQNEITDGTTTTTTEAGTIGSGGAGGAGTAGGIMTGDGDIGTDNSTS